MSEPTFYRPWASFCISTYKRPQLLLQQLKSLLQQNFKEFEIVVSDNDPDASAKTVALSLADTRIKYFHNVINLGMIGSFNKSIERASANFVVMVTDDDPVDIDLLSKMHDLWLNAPQYGVYGGFERRKKPLSNVEIIKKENFLSEILDPKKTSNMLWSSCVMKKEVVIAIGKIPDYGSPHLADHALIGLVGDIAGGVVINKMYSSLTSHDSNFSKANFEYYLKGCHGFYATMRDKMKNENLFSKRKAIDRHLRKWIIANVYNLKKYYLAISPNREKLTEINSFTKELVSLPFMRKHKIYIFVKEAIFRIKVSIGFIRKKQV
jgi:glycosyltransferase involved in cell wall biosynthesis